MRTVGACGLLAAAALLAVPALAEPLAEIEYASPDQSVWTIRSGANGEPGNPLLRVAEVLFARAGLPWRARSYPAVRMFQRLQDGQSQFSMLVRAPALSDCCILGSKPFTRVEIRAYRRAGTPPLRSREDLAGKSVIVIRGYSYGGLSAYINDPAQRITAHTSSGHLSAVRMLDAGRADYLIDYAGPAGEALEAESVRGVTSELLSRQEVYLVLSKKTPGAPALMSRLEAILDTLDVDALLAPGR